MLAYKKRKIFDESIDMMDTAQLAIFIRSIDFNFNVTEELVALFLMKSTTNSPEN